MSVAVMTAKAQPEFRAAGTDLSERRRSGVSRGPLVDIAANGDSAIPRNAWIVLPIGASCGVCGSIRLAAGDSGS